MCGRFVSSSSAADIARYFDVAEVSEQAVEHSPDYNTAPTKDVLVVFEEEKRGDDGPRRRLDAFHWGLVPRWAKDLKIGNRLINARAESLADKPAFRYAFRHRRCIVPADGFYEWSKPPGDARKQPWYIHRPDGEPLAFAGLWEQWRGHLPGESVSGTGTAEEGSGSPEVTLRSVTIITGDANAEMARVHDRMPVILPHSAWAEWLDPATEDTAALQSLLVPAPAELLVLQAVSTEVNNVRNNGPELIDPVELDRS